MDGENISPSIQQTIGQNQPWPSLSSTSVLVLDESSDDIFDDVRARGTLYLHFQ